jgi:hypothetical protein
LFGKAEDKVGPFLPFSVRGVLRCDFTEPSVRAGRSLFNLARSLAATRMVAKMVVFSPNLLKALIVKLKA